MVTDIARTCFPPCLPATRLSPVTKLEPCRGELNRQMNRQTSRRRYFIARLYANYDEAVRTIDLVGDHGDPDEAEKKRQRLKRSGELAENTSLIVTAGRNWAEAEQELKARLGD